MATRRQRRVSELIHRELSLLLLHEVRDPRLAGVTLTEVDVTPDLMIARIYLTVMGEEEARVQALKGLDHAKGFLRSQLASRVELRYVPELEFKLDKSADYARRIDELLDRLQESRPTDDKSDAE